jgi:hypothetical protein
VEGPLAHGELRHKREDRPETITGDRIVEGTLAKVPSVSFADDASYADSANPPAFAKVGGTVDCPAPAVEVQTFEGGARTKEGFYVVLYR